MAARRHSTIRLVGAAIAATLALPAAAQATLSPGEITTIAGAGTRGSSPGPALSAEFESPLAAATLADGSTLIGDGTPYGSCVRKLSADWTTIGMFAGIEPFTPPPSPGGGLVPTDGGACDYPNGDRRDNAPALTASVIPQNLVQQPDGSVLMLEPNFLRKIDTQGNISTLAGSYTYSNYPAYGPVGSNLLRPTCYCSSGDGGPATAATLSYGQGLARLSDGSIVLGDMQLVRRIYPDGHIATIAGASTTTGTYSGGNYSGPAVNASLGRVMGVAAGPDDSIYVSTVNVAFFGSSYAIYGCVQKIDPAGDISTFAGSCAQPAAPPSSLTSYTGDGGPATQATFVLPSGVTYANGTVYVADAYADVIRAINRQGLITTYAGNGIVGYSGDGGPAAQAELNLTDMVALDNQLAVDRNGELLVPDTANFVVRAIAPPAPVNLTPPTIQGAAVPGGALTVDPGTWSYTPTSYTYTWEACDASANNCTPTIGGTNASLTTACGDTGRTFRVSVAASVPTGTSDPVTSTPTAPVGGAAVGSCAASSSNALTPVGPAAPAAAQQAPAPAPPHSPNPLTLTVIGVSRHWITAHINRDANLAITFMHNRCFKFRAPGSRAVGLLPLCRSYGRPVRTSHQQAKAGEIAIPVPPIVHGAYRAYIGAYSSDGGRDKQLATVLVPMRPYTYLGRPRP
jgi:hypothetical protein